MPPLTLDELIGSHFTLEAGTSKGGYVGFTCEHCFKSYTGSQTRQIAHLLGTKGKGIAICTAISLEERAAVQDFFSEAVNTAAGGPSSSTWPEIQTGV